MNKSKSNFLVSNCEIFWRSDTTKCFISNPLLAYAFKNKFHSNFNEVNFGRHLRVSSKDLKKDADYVDAKYKMYSKLISKRLNKIHNRGYSTFFWTKALSISFIRQINIVYDFFTIFENFFDKNEHVVNVLSSSNYTQAKDYTHIEDFITENPIGSEQIFSLYINLFYKENIDKVIFLNKRNRRKFNIKAFIISVILKIKRFFLTSNKALITVGFFGSYFSKPNKKKLLKSNKGLVGEIFINIPKARRREIFNNDLREIISKKEENFDRFDTFFFESQKYFFPIFFLESYIFNENFLINKLKLYRNLKTIISENWISNSTTSLTLALAKEKFNINHFNNEHNFISHVFKGKYINYLISLSDAFYNVGWKSDKDKVIKSASLYNFFLKKNKTKIDILFLAGPIRYKRKYLASIDVFSQENALNTVNFNRIFFGGLKTKILKKIYYKKYPVKYFIDKEKLYLNQFTNINLLNQASFNGLDLMVKSKLVIMDYISTSYLECLISDVPMIVFLDQDSHKLKDIHKNFFKPLIDSEIFQVNPIEASNLLNRIHKNPLLWWKSKKVQRGRKVFLEQNIGDPETFISQITKIAST
jgi:putative transferase (TIGR04331 family)